MFIFIFYLYNFHHQKNKERKTNALVRMQKTSHNKSLLI